MKANRLAGAALLVAAMLIAGSGEASRQSKISATKHNLSSSNTTGTTHSTSESQICAFCHTPHGSDTSVAAPLWNKTLQNTTYTPYTASSLDAAAIQGSTAGQPLGSSKLCLSCHDGVMALGSVRVLRGQLNSNVGSGGNTAGSGSLVIGNGTNVTMPAGSGATTGYTRLLGTDLSNDHPISVTLNTTLSQRDGELRDPGPTQEWGTVFGLRSQSSTARPTLPLPPTGASGAGQVQCTTCHDPHIRESDTSTAGTQEGNTIKFLRLLRFQKGAPTVNGFTANNDIICLACHDKGMQTSSDVTWAYSTHANQNVKSGGTTAYTYKSATATTREFPKSGDPGITADLPVWRAACLNCHDTHTVTGARHLLREGVDSGVATAAGSTGFAATNLGSGGFMAGTTGAALEQTCYQCHTDSTTSIITPSPPNVAKDFGLTYRMRIRSADQPAGGSETHDVGGNFNDSFNNCTTTTNKCGADLIESTTNLGNGNSNNRHVECTDCHNPHRVVKFQKFYGNAGSLSGTPDASGTHTHTDTTMAHTNVASGVLRGSWGVEPSYGSDSFYVAPSNYTVRRGDPGTDTVPNDGNADTKTYVTREYQVCLKCHSSYGFGSTPPNLDSTNAKGLTPAGTNTVPGVGNALTQYTDVAREIQAPASHQNGTGDGTVVNQGWDGGANGGSTTNSPSSTDFNTNNHRSWHPVMRATGRTLAKRGITTTAPPWYLPWGQNATVGSQTMYCTDCHGSVVTGTGKLYGGGAATTNYGTVIPDSGNAWGPHGSNDPFILKGIWNKDAGGSTGYSSTSGTLLCFRCHDKAVYTSNSDTGHRSGFYDGKNGKGNLHNYHVDRIGQELQCSWCHVAVPHGWKNKMLLVNLNDVGEEAGLGAGSSKEVAMNGNNDNYTKPPYYLEAKLKIIKFSKSGSWDLSNCGTAQKTGSNLIAATNGNTTNFTSTVSGIDWMKQTCYPPP